MRSTFMALAVVVVGLLSGCGRQESGVITLSYVNFPPAGTFPCVQMERWAAEVSRRSGGRLRVETYPGGILLDAKQIVDGVTAGTADIGNFAMSYHANRFPISEAMDLPYFLPDSRTASRILAELLREHGESEFPGLKILTAFTSPPGVVMSRTPILTPAGLAGQQLRTAATSLEAIRLLGGLPVAMPQSDVPDALQKGVVKGLVSSPEVLKDMNYAAYCPHLLPLQLPVISFAVVMNRGRYDALPEDLRQILDDLYLEQAEWTGDYVDRHTLEAIDWAKAVHGLQVATVTPADRQQLAGTLDILFRQYVEKLQKRGLDGQKYIDFIRQRLPADQTAKE